MCEEFMLFHQKNEKSKWQEQKLFIFDKKENTRRWYGPGSLSFIAAR